MNGKPEGPKRGAFPTPKDLLKIFPSFKPRSGDTESEPDSAPEQDQEKKDDEMHGGDPRKETNPKI